MKKIPEIDLDLLHEIIDYDEWESQGYFARDCEKLRHCLHLTNIVKNDPMLLDTFTKDVAHERPFQDLNDYLLRLSQWTLDNEPFIKGRMN